MKSMDSQHDFLASNIGSKEMDPKLLAWFCWHVEFVYYYIKKRWDLISCKELIHKHKW